jgi:hypothetical protein
VKVEMDVIMAMDELLFPCNSTMANRSLDLQACLCVTLPTALRSRRIRVIHSPAEIWSRILAKTSRIFADRIGVNPLPSRRSASKTGGIINEIRTWLYCDEVLGVLALVGAYDP